MKTIPLDELHPEPEEVVEEEENPKDKKDKKNVPEPTEEELKEKEEAMKRGNPRIHPGYKPNVLNPKQVDLIWLDLLNLFNSYNFYEISEKILDYFSQETKEDITFKIQEGKILLFRKEYDKVIDLTNSIIEKNPFSYEPYLLQGHALYYEKKYKESEKAYIKAITSKKEILVLL